MMIVETTEKRDVWNLKSISMGHNTSVYQRTIIETSNFPAFSEGFNDTGKGNCISYEKQAIIANKLHITTQPDITLRGIVGSHW